MRAVVLVALAGCGPNLAHLAADHHYREAICGAHDGGAHAKELVGDALDGDAALALHVRPIAAAELAPLVRDAGPTLATRVRFARVTLQTNALPVDGLDVSVAFVNDGERVAELVDWDTLSKMTNEPLPAKQLDRTYATNANALRVIGAFFTAGVSLAFSPLRAATVERLAPDVEYARVAPIAHALYHAMPNHCDPVASDGELGASCTWFFAIPIRSHVSARLDIKAHYAAKRRDRMGEPLEATCVVERTRSIELGDLDDLDATTARLFGAGMRPVADLAR